jgi:membrane fusion protein, copper/silver efflux system
MNITKSQLLTYAIILLAGIIFGWLIFGGSTDHNGHSNDHLSDAEMEQHIQEEHTDEQGDIVWTCSMHPSVREDEPGNCPICGMELIPARANDAEAEEDEYSMVMTEAAMRLAQVQTAMVQRGIPQKELHLPGRIQVDERRISYVTTHFEGRVRDVKIDFTGAPIRQGEVMATVYSPELITAQRELIEAAKNKERNPRLYESARRKFLLWEFTDEQIRAIEERGVVQDEMEILSPVNGYVVKRNVVDEQHVMEGTVIYEVINLDDIWVVLEAYEEDISWISVGDHIHFHTRGNPGNSWEAEVSFIDPVVDPQKRTVRVRGDIQNSSHELKPDMLVRGNLHAGMDTEKLMVPASSVLWTGPRSLVYVKDTSVDVPRFEVREVELGPKAGDYYVIEEGVEEGEEVVFHGNFRIDSEMQLADRFSMMNREPGRGAVPVHDHGDREIDDDHDHEAMDTADDAALHEHAEAVDGATETFRQDFIALLEAYISGKEALFSSEFDAAAEAFRNAGEELESIGMHRMDGDAHMKWMQQYEAIEEHLNHILEAGDLDGQREGFAELSHILIEAVKNYEIPGVVYHQYCPMEEVHWLSTEEQIENPYAPETMPSCGEVIERIES